AVNLVGITTSQLQRGDVLTRPGWLVPASMLSVRLSLLPYLSRALPHNATVSFHTGAAETMAKVRFLEAEKLPPGEATWAQLVLDSPVAVVKDDYFIIRSTQVTLGGGKVVALDKRRLRRFRPQVIQGLQSKEAGTAEEIITAVLETKQPLEMPALLVECNLPEREVRPLIESLIEQGQIVGIGQGEHRLLYTSNGWERLTEQAAAILQDYHRRYPSRSGMSKAELGNRLRLGRHATAIWQGLVDRHVLLEEGTVVRLPSHQVTLTQAQQEEVAAFLKSINQNPYAPPGDRIPGPDLLNWLIEQQQVVKVSDDVVFSAAAYGEMVAGIKKHIQDNGQVTLAEVRDLFQTSRKYAQALMEYLDARKVTRRVGDQRVLY
ncbi:MAG: SelB C-terminal domain-containing protein, partial [Dehalococcoidales bacterium]